ncbi:MAG: hypothetical protein JW929_00515 [Anaerolineales bacterium]|nr:hypothetical protein [Anaerolineales bacterium]
MHIIANRWKNLTDGYRSAQDSSATLDRKWAGELKEVNKDLNPYLAQSISKQKEYLRLAIGSLLASLTVILAVVTLPLSIYFYIRYRLLKRDNDRLSHPPSPDIMPRWWRAVESGFAAIEKDGDIGEVELIRSLAFRLPDTHMAIRGLLVDMSLDVDVLILGDSGAWNLESKYWSGALSFKNGRWSRIKSYYARGGIPVNERQDMEKGFDAQWQRETKELGRTLERRAAKAGAELAGHIKGGLVFTHPDVRLAIDPDCPVKCGKTDYWIKRILESPAVIRLDTRSQLETLDALIDYSDKCQAQNRLSAVDPVKKIAAKTDSEITGYLKFAKQWLAKAKDTAHSEAKAPAGPAKAAPVASPAKTPPVVKPVSPKRNHRWLLGLAAAAIIAGAALCGLLVIPAAGINAPEACAYETTMIYDQPISKAHTSGELEKKECVRIDAKTTSGWGRITGLTVYRGKWVYLGVFTYDPKEISKLPIVKPKQ